MLFPECTKAFVGQLGVAIACSMGVVIPREVCRALRIALVSKRGLVPRSQGGSGATVFDEFLTFLGDAEKGLGFVINATVF